MVQLVDRLAVEAPVEAVEDLEAVEALEALDDQ